ncbi:T9SS type A sorting domain-containing protein [Aequorivita sp. CIP111184]|uniref:T9SS type A sorting domain-containing protein n=1 Tax=Aequorivita sp. CIP111184 TaxID=2211356 RepID=UPI0015EBC322|nr:T9SS type A sorting domain-containing protein [Aequorivita sp. CIP111184]
MERNSAYNIQGPNYFTRQVNVDENGNNIVGDAGNETSIAVDPTNPNRIVIGWRQFDSVTSNFRQAGNGYSLDGGLSWTFPGVLDPGIFRSDPVLDFDKDGNFYYNSLTGDFTCEVYKITDGGNDWGSPVSARGGDKQWMRIDRTDGIGEANNYSYWNGNFSNCIGAFTRSTDGSETFEDCIFIDDDPVWGTLAVDAEGALYLTGTSNLGIILVKSTSAKDPSSNVMWDMVTQVDLDGDLRFRRPVNPEGLMGQAWVDVDVSNGSGQGNVYVAASVFRFSNNDPGDVMFAKSTDGGNTFLPPVRINTDSGTEAYQWFGTMAVAPNGRIDVVWLDTRNATNGIDSELYYSFSEDEGETWSENESISEIFDPSVGYPQQNKMGDYFDMVSDDEYVHLAWANTLNGGQDVYYTRISPSGILNVETIAVNNFQLISYPNPFTDKISLEFTLINSEKVLIEVFDVRGRKLNTLLDEIVSWKQKILWNGTSETGTKLASGLYFITLKSETKSATLKVILK